MVLVDLGDELHEGHGTMAHRGWHEALDVKNASKFVYAPTQFEALVPESARPHLVHPDVVPHKVISSRVANDIVVPEVPCGVWPKTDRNRWNQQYNVDTCGGGGGWGGDFDSGDKDAPHSL